MIKITDKSLCCGCSACWSVCPVDAITMYSDKKGFLYPEVDTSKCMDCSLCDSVCDFSQRRRVEIEDDFRIEVYAAHHNDMTVVGESQSGGVFSALSSKILDEGGVVYGAAFNDDFTVSHKRAATVVQRDCMRGSKYVQSDMGDIFRHIRSDLSSGLAVMFTGTPCQVAGLKSCIPDKLQKNLLLVDFVCHGVPSPAIWKDYVDFRTGNSETVLVNFRDKKAGGWKSHMESFTELSGKKRLYKTYARLFYKEVMHRDSCYECPYNMVNRVSDITISDFWGVGDIIPDAVCKEGTSMVVCRTDKGRAQFERSASSLIVTPVILNKDFIVRHNPNMLAPTRPPEDRQLFWNAYDKHGFLYVAKRWSDIGWRYKMGNIKDKIKRKLGII